MEPLTYRAPHAPGRIVLRRTIARCIDDGILTVLSVLIALAIDRVVSGKAGQGTLLNVSGDLLLDASGAAVLLTGLLSTVLFLFYVGNAAGRRGATVGRAAAGIRVVARNGQPLSATVVFGRELVRVALVCLSLALISPVGSLLGSSFSVLVTQIDGRAETLITTAVTALVPVGVVVAGWIGAALLDPEGRAPHDRLARSTVVRTNDVPS